MLRAGNAIKRMIAAARLAALVPGIVVLSSVAALAENLPSASIAHGLALYGEPALPQDFHHFPYANPDAPKGGRLRLGQRGASIHSTQDSATRRNSSSAMYWKA
jgi:peptide/nickel transport system substrate-binding protein